MYRTIDDNIALPAGNMISGSNGSAGMLTGACNTPQQSSDGILWSSDLALMA